MELGFAPATAWFRDRLLDRRRRLVALPGLGERQELSHLLHEIDGALERIERETFGVCEECHESIEGSRLLADPAVRVCLGCLSEAEQRTLERDIEAAARAQRALLPPAFLSANGWEIAHRYRPLGPVSGDYCDALVPQAGGATVHFVLGDVSGKGIAASLLMAHLQAILRSVVTAEAPLADVVSRANRILCQGVVSSSFSTLLLGRLTPDGLLEICNAGHCPALLARDGEVTSVGATGMPLGIFGEASYEVARFRIEPGESLLLYTDGLSEAENAEGEAYGPERVEAMARRLNGEPAGNALDRCLAELEAFQAGAPRHDDLTLMMIRREAH